MRFVKKTPNISLVASIAGLAAGLFWACSTAQEGPALRMMEYLRAAQEFWKFQGSALVSRGGQIVFETGLGMARLGQAIRNTPSTRFLIGSVTKTFTSAAIMQLAEGGRLDLDDPLRKYVPEYPEKTGTAITLRHLLSHTSGIPEAVPDPRVLGDLMKPVAPLEILRLVKDKDLNFAPGEKSEYSNMGYVLLGMVIERVTKQSFYKYLQDHMFGPLGMTSSGYRENWYDTPGFALGYADGGEGRLTEAPRIHLSLGFSAGGLYSTVQDLLKWDRGLSSDKILSVDSKKMMFRPTKDNFGYGWLVLRTWGRTDLAHGGGAPGFNAWVERWPEEEVFVAVLSNIGSSSVGEIGRSLAAIFFGEGYQSPEARRTLSIAPDLLDEYAGSYRIDTEDIRHVFREGETLFVRRNDGRKYPILPYAKDGFFFPNDKGATVRFRRDGSGRVIGHVFHQLGLDGTAIKIR